MKPEKIKVTKVSGVTTNPAIAESDTLVVTRDLPGVSSLVGNHIPTAAKCPIYCVFDEDFEHKGEYIKAGVWHFTTNAQGEINKSWLFSPLHIEAITFDDQENNFGRLLRFKDTLGKWRKWVMPMQMLSGRCEELRSELLARGLNIEPQKGSKLLANYLHLHIPKCKLLATLQVGWFKNSFVLPDTIYGTHTDKIIFQSMDRKYNEYTQKGSLESWQSELSMKAIGNSLLMVSLSAAFAGPLIKLCHGESGGLHFVGESSTGKTTLLHAACSVWGGDNFRRSWRTTANGLEGVAVLFNDCLLALDEISECHPSEVGSIIYSLGNGRGKQRASKTGHAQPVARWETMIVSTGERTIATTMQEAGQRTKAGQGVRLLDIPANRTHGIWDVLHDAHNGANMSDAIKTACKEHHGRAGIAFLQKLVFDTQDFQSRLKLIKADKRFTLDDNSEQENRAAARFALIALAGEVATEYGITGWNNGDAIQAAAESFKAWNSLRERGNSENAEILERITSFIEQHGDSRFSNRDAYDHPPVHNRAGWWEEKSNGNRDYLFSASGLRTALKGLEFNRSLDILESHGVLPPAKADGKRSIPIKINGRSTRVYRIQAPKIDYSEGCEF